MNKRIKAAIAALTILASLTLASCGSAQDAGQTTAGTAPATEPVSTEASRTVTGTASLTWHGTMQFVAAVDVAVSGETIESITLRSGSVVSTDAFDGWEAGKEAYLAQYAGMTLDQIRSLKTREPMDTADHMDGGAIEGDVDAISGATASSTVIAMAVQNAVEKLEAK